MQIQRLCSSPILLSCLGMDQQFLHGDIGNIFALRFTSRMVHPCYYGRRSWLESQFISLFANRYGSASRTRAKTHRYKPLQQQTLELVAAPRWVVARISLVGRGLFLLVSFSVFFASNRGQFQHLITCQVDLYEGLSDIDDIYQ